MIFGEDKRAYQQKEYGKLIKNTEGLKINSFKGAEATWVKIATQRWKNALDWKKWPISMFSEIFSPYMHVLAALFRK